MCLRRMCKRRKCRNHWVEDKDAKTTQPCGTDRPGCSLGVACCWARRQIFLINEKKISLRVMIVNLTIKCEKL